MPLQLIGAGLGRTGTLSLKVALEMLGLGPCYHMIEVMAHSQRPNDWIQAANGQLDWDAVFDGYGSTVDYPGCTFWRELAQRYPTAKVLLSVRDANEWFDSTQATIFSPQMRQQLSRSPVAPFFDKAVWGAYGDRIHDREFMVGEFERHAAEVQRSIPKERLLVYRLGDGWKPLCDFLGVAVPDAPFPRTNSRDELAAMIAERAKAAGPDGSIDMQHMSRHAKSRIDKLATTHRKS